MVLRIAILVVALGAAGGAAFLTTMMGANAPDRTAGAEVIQKKDVLVAVAAIGSGEVLAPDKIRWTAMPLTRITEKDILRETSPDAVADLSGRFVNRAFAEGEPIRSERLMKTNINLLSNKISKGMRAAAVKITAEKTAGGFILPGDRVDVIHTVTLQAGSGQQARHESKIIITNARVLAIDQAAVQAPEGSKIGKTATLELTPEDSERIMAAEASGLLSLALRPVTDHHIVTKPRVTEIRTVRVHRASKTATVTLH